ncbi:helix-turn-helix domain-containing protein [Vibrio mediterranei]
MTNQSVIAKNILKRMDDLGIKSKVTLSDISGVSRTVITNIILMPNKSVMIESAIKLANALECRVEWLITGIGPINDADQAKQNRLDQGVPVISLNALAKTTAQEILTEVSGDESIRRIPCPAGNSKTRFVVNLNVVKLSEPWGSRYEAGGMLFFDHEVDPISGQLVIAKTTLDSAPDIMEFISVHGRKFLKSLNDDIPEDLVRIEMTDDMEIIASNVSYAVNR